MNGFHVEMGAIQDWISSIVILGNYVMLSITPTMLIDNLQSHADEIVIFQILV